MFENAELHRDSNTLRLHIGDIPRFSEKLKRLSAVLSEANDLIRELNALRLDIGMTPEVTSLIEARCTATRQ